MFLIVNIKKKITLHTFKESDDIDTTGFLIGRQILLAPHRRLRELLLIGSEI